MVVRLLTLYNEFSKKNFELHDDDDVIDKMSRKFSTIMMLVFAFVVSTAQLVGEPIKCWCPNDYSGSRCAYATTYCYITNQYVPVSNGTEAPPTEKLLSHKIIYYQWIAYIFLFQAILFYFPCLVWRWLNTKSGFSIRNYIEELRKDKSVNIENPAVKYVSAHLESCLLIRKNYLHRGQIKGLFVDRFGMKFVNTTYLFMCHIFVKFLYAIVAFLQIIMLNYWLRDHHYSVDHKSMLFGMHNWKLSERFPRMILCKFWVYIQMFDQQPHWLQCTLPINIYIEKIYIFIWIWLWVLFAMTLAGIIGSIYKSLPFYRKRFIGMRLRKQIENDRIADEVYKLLKIDGVLALSLIKSNTNDVNVNAIMKVLGGEKTD